MPDVIDMLRQQLQQGQGQAPPPPQDAISAVRAQLQSDVTQMPELSEHGPRMGELTKPGMDWIPAVVASVKMFMNDDPEKLAKSLEGTTGITIKRDKNDQPYAEVAGEKYALNRPGASQQDAAYLVGQIASQIGVGRLFKALPFIGGAGRVVSGIRDVLAGGTAAAGMEAAGEKVAGQEVDPLSVGVQGGIGAAGTVAGTLLGSTLGRLFKSGAEFLDPHGTLTATAVRALRAAGIDVGTLDNQTLRQTDAIIKRQVGTRATPEEMVEGVARSDMQDTGIDLSEAARTGNRPAGRREAGIAQGARGGPGQDVMDEFKQRQEAQARAAVGNMATGESPGIGPINEAEAGSNVRADLQTAQHMDEAAVDHLYDTAAQHAQNSGVVVDSNWRLHGPQFQLRNLGMADVNEGTAPKTAAVVNFLQDQFNEATRQARRAAIAGGVTRAQARGIQGEFNPQELEGLRKKIALAARNTSDPTDKAALVALRGKYDDFLDQEVGSQAPDVVEHYRDARDMHAEMKNRFTPQSQQDVGGKLIQKTVEGDNSDQKIVDTVFGGGNKISPEGVLHFNRLSDTLGSDSDGVKSLRQTMVRRIVLGNADAQAKGGFNPKSIVASIDTALEGKGSQYVQQTLGPDTLRNLQVLRRTLDRVARNEALRGEPGKFLNEAAARAIGRLSLTGAIGSGSWLGGTALGGPIVGTALAAAAGGATNAAVKSMGAAAGRRAAMSAINQVPMVGPRISRAITGPIGRTAEGLLPAVGGAGARSLFDIYGPDNR